MGKAIRHIMAIGLLTAVLLPATAFAWPTASQWIPIYRDGAVVQDSNTDANGSRNIVSGPGDAAAYYFNDGAYLYFRLRLDDDPSGTGGQGLLQSFGWGFEIDTNQNPTDYEWLVMVDGIGTEGIDLWQNTIQGTINDPGDKAEILAASIPLAGNFQVNLANTSFNGDPDYFLDWRFPYSTFVEATGLGPNSLIRFYEGSSSSTMALTDSGGDLVGASDLSSGFSDYITFLGTGPATGTVRFVTDLAGNGDMTEICPGNTVYIRVDDTDQDYDFAAQNTVTATLTTPNGDSETRTLTETGIHTGFFTGSIPSISALPAPDNGILEVMPGETVTVTYIDAVDALLQFNQVRTDTLVVTPPSLAIQKTVSPIQTISGGTVTYSLTITNASCGEAWLNQIQDTLPAGFSYVLGSTEGFTTDAPTINGQILEWHGSWIVPADGSLTFTFDATATGAAGTYYNNVSANGSNFSTLTTGNTAPVTITAPLLQITKQVDKETAGPGEEIIYSVHYKNLGNGIATTLIIMDQVPLNTAYVANSLRLGTADSNYPSATAKTDAADGDEASSDGTNIMFVIPVVQPDDGVLNSGTDEGKAYFKVIIE